MKTTMTAQDIRERLPGHEIRQTLISDGEGNGIEYVFQVRGCLDELITVDNFWVYYRGQVREVVDTIEEARKAWRKYIG